MKESCEVYSAARRQVSSKGDGQFQQGTPESLPRRNHLLIYKPATRGQARATFLVATNLPAPGNIRQCSCHWRRGTGNLKHPLSIARPCQDLHASQRAAGLSRGLGQASAGTGYLISVLDCASWACLSSRTGVLLSPATQPFRGATTLVSALWHGGGADALNRCDRVLRVATGALANRPV